MSNHHIDAGGGGGGSGGGFLGSGSGYSGDERESRSGGEDRPESDLSDKPMYLLEHLATFTVNKESGIVYPADGMRRLLQLEKTTGIWSQKMQLCLDYQWALIMDYETGNIIERFPATLIQEPTAFTSNDPMEMYNNILVFIVSGGSGSRSEMHIFQSQSVSAVYLVEDLKNLRSGKVVTPHRDTLTATSQTLANKSSLLSSVAAAAAAEAVSRIQHRNSGGAGAGHNDQYGMREREMISSGGGGHETDSETGCGNDETSSTSSDKYERDVTVLNHCFDDIEKFIARLQHAAAASRELERRRRNRKSKKKDPGEGLLTLRTRPPHEKEFIDIFAKFKLSFNLLAKLKAHIHDPNAPELVHFLFTPLALIVEASSDTYYESQLPARVINPLLTREAINLLINCVTSKETELWRSLGDAWTVPRDQWKDDVGSYHPVFLDGWSPDYLVIDELEHPTTPTNIKRRIDLHHINFGNSAGGGASGINDSVGGGGGDYDYDGPSTSLSEKYTMHHHQTSGGGAHDMSGGVIGMDRDRERVDLKDFSARSDISTDSIERTGGGGETAARHNASIGMHYHHNQKHKHIGKHQSGDAATMHNAEVLQSITDRIQSLHTREGIGGGLGAPYGGNIGGGSGIGVPPEVASGRIGNNSGGGANGNDDQMIEVWLDDLQAAGAKIVLVTYPRTANNDKEMSVVRGEYLEVLDDSRKWWKARNSRGQVAHVPHTIVTPYNYNENEFNNQY